MDRDDAFNLAILLMNVLLGALCLAVARGGRTAPALRYWGWGLFAYTGGILVVTSSLLGAPRALVYLLGNVLITIAPLLSMRGLLWHTPTRFDPTWAVLAVTPVLAVLVWNNLIGEYRSMLNTVPPTLVAIAAFAYGAARLLMHPPVDAQRAARLVGVVSLLAVLLWTVRSLILTGLLPLADPEHARVAGYALAIAQILVSVAGTVALLGVEVRSMEAILRRKADNDPLTGLPNQFTFAERFREELARATRQGQSLALLLLDIDHFRRINDQYGHLAGDSTLRMVAATLAMEKRAGDVLARYGGEQFLLLLPGADSTQALHLGEQLRQQVAAASIDFGGLEIRVTLSGGLAVFPENGASWEALFATADGRLQRAKNSGRNQLCGSGRTLAAVA